MITLKSQPLTRKAFAPFGEAIDVDGLESRVINQGFAEKFQDIANIDVSAEGGETSVHIFIAKPRPATVAVMERHPLGSQLFLPLQNLPWRIIVCHDPADPKSYMCFDATGLQGINYARNTWHHPLIALDPDCRFIAVDRKGPGNNLEEVHLQAQLLLSV